MFLLPSLAVTILRSTLWAVRSRALVASTFREALCWRNRQPLISPTHNTTTSVNCEFRLPAAGAHSHHLTSRIASTILRAEARSGSKSSLPVLFSDASNTCCSLGDSFESLRRGGLRR